MSELSVGALSGLAANSYVIDVASGSQLTQPGMILQVVSTTKTDTFSASVGARPTISGAVTGLSATITPTSASSKILVFGSITGSAGTVGLVHYHLFRDGSASAYTADPAGNRQVSASGRLFAESDANLAAYSLTFLDTANSTSATTYDFRISHDKTTTSTVYVNRSVNDVDQNNLGRGASSITLMEVAG